MCLFFTENLFVLLPTLIPSSPTPLKFIGWLIRRFNINLQSVVKVADISRMGGGGVRRSVERHQVDRQDGRGEKGGAGIVLKYKLRTDTGHRA